jgi:hypothetical protein
MPALTSLLVRDAVLSIHMIEDALQRQVLEGGEIDTVLLEMAAAPENVLNAYRAASFGLLPASRHELMSIPRGTLRAVPIELVERYRVVPVSEQQGRVVLAVSSPLDESAVELLRERLGAALVFKGATEVRVEAALAAHYALAIAPRLQLLAEKLEARDPGVLPDVYPLDQDKVSHFEGDFVSRLTAELSEDELESEAEGAVELRQRKRGEAKDKPPLRPSLEMPPIVRTAGGADWASRDEAGGEPAEQRGEARQRDEQAGELAGEREGGERLRVPAGESGERPAFAEEAGTLRGMGERRPSEPAVRVSQPPRPASEPTRPGSQPPGEAGGFDKKTTLMGISGHEPERKSTVGVSRVVGVGVAMPPAGSKPAPRSKPAPQLIEGTAGWQEPGAGRAAQEREQRPSDRPHVALRSAFPSADVVRRPSSPEEARPSDRPPSGRPPSGRPPPSRPPSDRPGRRYMPRGPLTPGVERELLNNAEDRDEVVEIWLAFARQYFDCAVIFAFREESVVGLDCHGVEGIADIRAISVAIEPDSALHEVRRAGTARVVDMGKKPADRMLLSALRRMDFRPCLLLPVSLRKRPVLLFYGDRGGEPFELEEVADLVEMVPSVVRAFERIVRARKVLVARGRAGAPSSPPAAGAAPAPEATPAAGEAPAAEAAQTGRVTDASRAAVAPPVAPGGPGAGAPTATAKDTPPEPVPSLVPVKRAEKELKLIQTLSGASGNLKAGVGRKLEETKAEAKAEAKAEHGAQARAEQRAEQRAAEPARRERLGDTLSGIPRESEPGSAAGTAKRTGAGRMGPTLDSELEQSDLGATAGVAERTGGRRMGGTLSGVVRESEPGSAAGTAERTASRRGGRRERTVTDSFESSADEQFDMRSTQPFAKPRVEEVPVGHRPNQMTSTDPMFKAKTGTLMGPGERRVTDEYPPVSPAAGGAAGAEGAGEAGGEQEEGRPAVISELMRWPERAVGDEEQAEQGEKPEPSVVVDMGSGADPLVEQLMSSDREQESEIVEALVNAGEGVLPALVQKFPGHVWFKRGQPYHRLPAGRDLSAVARAILAFGSVAVSYVRSLLYSSDPDVRFYALMLAGDLPYKSLLEPLEQRLFDGDAYIRRMAIDVMTRFRWVEGYDNALTSLRTVAAAPGRATDTRITAIEALAGLRDANSCLVLIHLLNSPDAHVVNAAHRALVTITLQDHKLSMRKWTDWIGRNRDRSRVEWMIESLTHADQAIRTAAGAELKQETKQYYDFHPSSSKRELKRVQKRYRQWWEAQGKAQDKGRSKAQGKGKKK